MPPIGNFQLRALNKINSLAFRWVFCYRKSLPVQSAVAEAYIAALLAYDSQSFFRYCRYTILRVASYRVKFHRNLLLDNAYFRVQCLRFSCRVEKYPAAYYYD